MTYPYVKTAAGLAEIGQRSDRLSRPLRNVLVCVDGKRDRAALQALGSSIGAPDDAVDQLITLELITPADAAAKPPPAVFVPPPTAAASPDDGDAPSSRRCAALADLAGEHLGLIRARGIQQRLQACRSEADLQALLPDLLDALASRLGEAQARLLLHEQLAGA